MFTTFAKRTKQQKALCSRSFWGRMPVPWNRPLTRLPFLIEPIRVAEIINLAEDYQSRRDLEVFRTIQQLADWFIRQETPYAEEEVSFISKVKRGASKECQAVLDKLSWSTSHQKEEVAGRTYMECHEGQFFISEAPKGTGADYYHISIIYKYDTASTSPYSVQVRVIEGLTGKKKEDQKEYSLLQVEGSDLSLQNAVEQIENFGKEKLGLNTKDTHMFWAVVFHLLGKSDLFAFNKKIDLLEPAKTQDEPAKQEQPTLKREPEPATVSA